MKMRTAKRRRTAPRSATRMVGEAIGAVRMARVALLRNPVARQQIEQAIRSMPRPARRVLKAMLKGDLILLRRVERIERRRRQQ